jgi:hypothetical protein
MLNHPKTFFWFSPDLSDEITGFEKLSQASRGGYRTSLVPPPDLSNPWLASRNFLPVSKRPYRTSLTDRTSPV